MIEIAPSILSADFLRLGEQEYEVHLAGECRMRKTGFRDLSRLDWICTFAGCLQRGGW